MTEGKESKTLNMLVGISVVMRIGLLAWQLHRMYRLEKAEKAMAARESDADNAPEKPIMTINP